jgi:lipid-binding SYLF domain-containing protein
MLSRRLLMLNGIAIAAVGCGTPSPNEANAKRTEINAGVDAAFADLYAEQPSARDLVSKAQGVLVIPKLISAVMFIVGTYGTCAFRNGLSSLG